MDDRNKQKMIEMLQENEYALQVAYGNKEHDVFLFRVGLAQGMFNAITRMGYSVNCTHDRQPNGYVATTYNDIKEV